MIDVERSEVKEVLSGQDVRVLECGEDRRSGILVFPRADCGEKRMLKR
jgi:hypothetical protein